MYDKITVTFNDSSTAEFEYNTPIFEIALVYQHKMANPILGVKVDNQVVDMGTKLDKNATLHFFDINDINGYKMYQAGLKFVLKAAVGELYGRRVRVDFNSSLEKGIMSRFSFLQGTSEVSLEDIKTKMLEIMDKNIPFIKIDVTKKEVAAYYETVDEKEKAINIRNTANSIFRLYKLMDYYNYFYVDMPYSTGGLKKFDLKPISDSEFLLLFPNPRSNGELPEFKINEKILLLHEDYRNWLKAMNLEYVWGFNKVVSEGNVEEYIRRTEIRFDDKLKAICDEIIGKLDKLRMVLIAGPSSSGKTTTTKELALRLRSRGIETLTISVDDYYKEMDERPLDEHGKKDLESLAALDTELFNQHLTALINGEEVIIPEYNFITGRKEYEKKPVRISDKTLILIEGLHCMNEELTSKISRDTKYKIYLNLLTPLGLDRHNHVSVMDLRMIRRIVRDNRTRGHDVSKTISHWQKVRDGEEKNIFPFSPDADFVLNTALVYELGVLKVYVEPLLFSVEIKSPYYEEARRLMSFLKSFHPVPSEFVPSNSILREFIG